ncbi:MAG TPA: mechanosensitive ion channel domain-containing protein [Polyangiaceae bacterium]|jgi:MscS family membrane protein|nr:mechanosensitive ion channel domain-containing protein [Polyangiaceae bacterium]
MQLFLRGDPAPQAQDWLLEHLPPSLREIGPQQLSWWQWLGLPVLAALALAFAIPLSRLTRAVLARVLQLDPVHGEAHDGEARLQRVSGPLLLAWGTLLFSIGLPWLRLTDAARAAVQVGVRATGVVAFYWALSRGIDIAQHVLGASSWGRAHTRALLPLASRVGKVFVVVLAVVALLSELGYAVTSLIAGLGIGGVAVALGAQKTLENLFGAFSIGADQPFLQGDVVRVGDLVGTVEVVGLRSTRIRTRDRTLVTIPNGKLADQQIESLAVRDRLFFGTSIRLVYGTRAEQLRSVLSGLEAALREQPKLWPEGVTVRFVGLGESSLDIDVQAWLATTDWNEFQQIRQELLLRFLQVVEAAGSAFAFPTQTVHVQPSPATRTQHHPAGDP